jgi:hypothetical protein
MNMFPEKGPSVTRKNPNPVLTRAVALSACSIMFATVLVLAAPTSVLATTLGGSHKGTTPAFASPADANNCTQFLDIDLNGQSDYPTPSGEQILRTVTGTVRSAGQPVANAIVFSVDQNWQGSSPSIERMTCVVTGEDGAFSIDVLNDGGYGSLTVSPPYTTLPYGVQLGSTSRPIEPGDGSLALGNIDLVAANSAVLAYSQSANDYVTSPSHISCFAFANDNNSDSEPDIDGGCALARGLALPQQNIVAMKTVSVTANNSTSNAVRFYLESNPGSVPSSFVVAGLPTEQAAFNGRWAAGNLVMSQEDPDGDGPLGTFRYVQANYGNSPTPTDTAVAFSATYPTLNATIWAAWNTIPSSATRYLPDGSTEQVNLADGVDRTATYWSFSRNRDVVADQTIEASRILSLNRTAVCGQTPAAGCNPFNGFTTLYSEATPWGRGVITFLTSGGGGGGGGGGGCGSAGTGNFSGVIVTSTSPETAATGCGSVQVNPFSATAWGGGPGWDWQNGNLQSSVDSNGQFGFSVPETKIYRLEFYPGGTSALTTTTLVMRFTVAGGSISVVESCADFSLQAGLEEASRCTSGWQTVARGATSSRYMVLAREANFFGQILKPNGSPIADNGNSWVEVQRLQQGGDRFDFQGGFGGTSSGAEGKFKLRLSSGSYKLNVNNPTGASYPPLSAYIKVVSDGDQLTFSRCLNYVRQPNSGLLADALTDCSAITTSAQSPLQLQFTSADLTGQVVGKSNFWVEIQKESAGNFGQTNWDWLGGTNANQSGMFAVNFETAGTYKLVMNPPHGSSQGETRTEIPVTVTISDNVKSLVVGPAGCVLTDGDCVATDGVYTFEFNSANMRGRVKIGEANEGFANASFERWNSDESRFEWVNIWANANSSGEFATTLTNGTWKITARPSWQNEGTASSSVAYVQVVTNAVSERGVATTQACAENNTGCGDDRYLPVANGVYTFTLGSPNLSGYVGVSDSIARDNNGVPANIANAVGNSWLEIQPWNEPEQAYRWSQEIPGVNTSPNGRFGTTLPAGNLTTNPESKYQVTVNPRPQDAALGRSRASYKLFVDTSASNVVKCEIAYANLCEAGQAPNGSRFNFYLSGANLTGTVTAGGTPVANGQVKAERWNGQWFDWVNLWAQTSSQGVFAMNLESAGTYKITAEPPSWNSDYSTFANISTYVRVADGALCVVSDENDDSCNGSSGASLNLPMALVGANIRGTVTANGQPVRNSWVNVMRYNSTLGWWEFSTGAPVSQSGTFSLSVSPTQDGSTTAGTQQRFKIEVMPPWGNSTLTRKEVQLWVGDVGQTSGSNHYKECAEAVFSNCTGTAKSGNKDTPDTLAVVLGAGNLSGKVTTDGTAGMPNAWLNVEKWMLPSWSPNPSWQWVDLHGNANQSGDYSIGLDAQGAGHYRITANPGWNNPNNLTRTSVVVLQTAPGAICRVDDQADSSCNDTAANPYTLNIQLAGSNLTGTLKNGADPVPFGWIGLLREQYQIKRAAITGVSVSEGTATYTTGSHSFVVGDIVSVRSASPAGLNITRKTVTAVTASTVVVAESGAEGTWTSGGVVELVNLPVASARANTWYEWTGGTNTSSTGVFGLRIASEGRYQLEVNPPWNQQLTRFSVFLYAADANSDGSIESGEIRICTSKSQSNSACATGSVWNAGSNSELSFPTSNVVIRVCSKESTSSSCTPVPNSWVNVFGGSEWLGGANTNGSGLARFSLPNGTNYRFEANPNWNRPDGSRAETSGSIVISGNSLDLTSVTVAGAVIAKSGSQIDMKLGSPNVTGSVNYRDGGTPDGALTVMPWAYVGVRKNLGGGAYDWLPGAPVDSSGNYKLTLEAGSYRLTAFPNVAVAERSPVSIDVTVAGDLSVVCTGGIGADGCSFDFDLQPPNVQFTLSNVGSLTRALYVFSGNDLVLTIAKSPTTGSVQASFKLANGTYSLRVQKLNTIGSDGSTRIRDFDGANGEHCRSYSLTISGDAVSDQAALDVWATGAFSGNDATTGLECASPPPS